MKKKFQSTQLNRNCVLCVSCVINIWKKRRTKNNTVPSTITCEFQCGVVLMFQDIYAVRDTKHISVTFATLFDMSVISEINKTLLY